MSKCEVLVEKIQMDDNPTDILTKTLATIKFKHCLSLINILGS